MGVESRESTFAIAITFPILTLVLILLRFHTRLHRKDGLRADDWLCVPAWVCFLGCCACLLIGAIKNVHKDSPIVLPEDVTPSQRLFAHLAFVGQKLYYVGSTLIKLSILYFYRRIFIGRRFNMITVGLIAFTLVWGVYAFIGSVLYCGTNVHVNWQGGWQVCPGYGFALQIPTFITNALLDLCLLVLPMPLVWKLQLPPVKKVLITFVFCIGGLAFVTSVINLVVQMASQLKPAVTEAGEQFFTDSWAIFYNLPGIEMGVSLITCNLPVLSFRASRALSRRLERGWMFVWGSVKKSSIHSERNGPPRRHIDSNARWLGNKWAGVGWSHVLSTKTFQKTTDIPPEKNRTPESSTTMDLSSAGNDSSMTDIWSADIAGLIIPERAETNPTTRYELEQTDSRSGMVDSQNGKVIGGFDAV